ncbi:hypothetical protein D3C87_1115450 [compost metagenome]
MLTKVDSHTAPLGTFDVPRHLPALVVGHTFTHRMQLSAALKPSIAEVAVASFIFTSIK